MSGGGGGIIIIREALKAALTSPLVHGNLPRDVQAQIDPFIHSSTSLWTHEQHRIAQATFNWASEHC